MQARGHTIASGLVSCQHQVYLTVRSEVIISHHIDILFACDSMAEVFSVFYFLLGNFFSFCFVLLSVKCLRFKLNNIG